MYNDLSFIAFRVVTFGLVHCEDITRNHVLITTKKNCWTTLIVKFQCFTVHFSIQ